MLSSVFEPVLNKDVLSIELELLNAVHTLLVVPEKLFEASI